jgi:hypothetical protein
MEQFCWLMGLNFNRINPHRSGYCGRARDLMTKELMFIFDDLVRKEWAKTLTPAETETLEELRHQSKCELDSWLAEGSGGCEGEDP